MTPTLAFLALCAFAFLAGFIDSVVGGGGLIQIPALLILLPAYGPGLDVTGVNKQDVFGTNKLASISGTAMATLNYARQVRLDWRAILPTAAAGFIFSWIGSRTLSLLNPALFRPLVLGLLILVAIYTFIRKDFGSLHAPRLSLSSKQWIGLGVGAALGFYDGFFGPGTGSFLIFIFIGVFGFDFLTSSAASKVVNTATNLSSVIYFAWTSHILYRLAIPMAVCNMLGSLTGTRLAMLRGSAFVRWLFLAVVSAIICKLAFDLAHSP